MITGPKIGEVYQLIGTQVTAEVKSVSPGWIDLEVSDENMSMHWRQSSAEFQCRWRIVEKAETTR